LDAWGPRGHAAVAALAQQRLTPAARAAVNDLLDGEAMASVSSWADDVRDTGRPDTYNWHFVDIPFGADGYDAARDCPATPRGDCIINALDRLTRDLADSRLPKDRRREALMFIIHFVGDIHQPLHAIDNGDLGGNRVQIKEIGGTTNLHAAWDTGIITAAGAAVDDLVTAGNAILQREGNSAVATMPYVDWALESHDIAKRIVYPQVTNDGQITAAEARVAMEIIERRIAYAGARLAAILNRTLGATSP
jgi:hypothetical protein